MLNKIIIQGRITDNIELRRTATGTPVTSFSVAVQRDVADKQTGERATDFIEVVAWNNNAEFASKHFGKGNMAIVVGRLQIRDWLDKAGNKRRTAEVIAENIYFGESKKTNTGDSVTYGGGFSEIDDDSDLPFLWMR